MQRGKVGRNDGIPHDDLRVRNVLRVLRRVGGGDVREDLLGVPVEEGGQVGIEVEGDVGVFLALRAVIVRAALDAVFWSAAHISFMTVGDLHSDVLQLESGRWVLRAQQDADGDGGGDCKGDGSEEAEDILDADETGMHDGRVWYGMVWQPVEVLLHVH